MESILLPALVAGTVFVVCLIIALKSISSDESQRKQALLGRIIIDSKEGAVVAEADYGKLLKYNPGDATSFPFNLPGVKNMCDLLVKAGLWEKRAIFTFAVFAVFVVVVVALHKMGAISILIALLAAYLLPTQIPHP